MEWAKNFFIPVFELLIIGGVGGTFLFFLIRGILHHWSTNWKYIFKYGIMRKKYPEATVIWILQCIEMEIGYYGIKKFLLVRNTDTATINETLWIWMKIFRELNVKKGGKINGRELKGLNSSFKTTTSSRELPNGFPTK